MVRHMDLHEYESKIAAAAQKMQISDGAIRAHYRNEYLIPLEKCSTEEKALDEAMAFAANLLGLSENVHWDTMALHFLELARRGNKLNFDPRSLYHGANLRLAGTLQRPEISEIDKNSSYMILEGYKNNYLSLTLSYKPTLNKRTLRIQRSHEYNTTMYEYVDVDTLGVVLINNIVIFSLPIGKYWNLVRDGKLSDSDWHDRYWTRIALQFEDDEDVAAVYTKLNEFLGPDLIHSASWEKCLTSQVKRTPQSGASS